MASFRELASGLRFPEGPVALADGSVLLVEIARGTLTRISPEGRTEVVAEVGGGPNGAAVGPDGKLLVASLKQGGSVQIFDLATGQAVMTEKSSTTVTHGVVISPDSRYAFVSNEGVGAAPGKVDVYDLPAKTRVASVDVRQQAGGIAFWKVEPAKD